MCAICMEEYAADDMITPLSCDNKHYFHTNCVEQWIEQGKNTCPLCRQDIDKDVLNRSRGSHGGYGAA